MKNNLTKPLIKAFFFLFFLFSYCAVFSNCYINCFSLITDDCSSAEDVGELNCTIIQVEGVSPSTPDSEASMPGCMDGENGSWVTFTVSSDFSTFEINNASAIGVTPKWELFSGGCQSPPGPPLISESLGICALPATFSNPDFNSNPPTATDFFLLIEENTILEISIVKAASDLCGDAIDAGELNCNNLSISVTGEAESCPDPDATASCMENIAGSWTTFSVSPDFSNFKITDGGGGSWELFDGSCNSLNSLGCTDGILNNSGNDYFILAENGTNLTIELIPVTNDDCSNANSLGNLNCSTSSVLNVSGVDNSCLDTEAINCMQNIPGVWETFTVSASVANFEIATIAGNWELFSGSCGSLLFEACPSSGTGSVSVPNTGMTTYFLLIDETANLEISSLCCSITNATVSMENCDFIDPNNGMEPRQNQNNFFVTFNLFVNGTGLSGYDISGTGISPNQSGSYGVNENFVTDPGTGSQTTAFLVTITDSNDPLCFTTVNVFGPGLAEEYPDDDDDGFGDFNEDPFFICDSDPLVLTSGFVDDNTDCNDDDDTIFPNAPELCDGKLNNCNGSIPPSEFDDDGDEYVECNNWVGDDPNIEGGGDCNDDPNNNGASMNPGLSEVCDGLDNDCVNGIPLDEIDNDGDDFVECNYDPNTWLGASNIIGGLDCDDQDNQEFPGVSWYIDVDGDGAGDMDDTPDDCDPSGSGNFVTNNNDCDDTNGAVNTTLPANPVSIDQCRDSANPYNLTQHDDDVKGGASNPYTVVWYNGNPTAGGTPINNPNAVNLDNFIGNNQLFAQTQNGSPSCSNSTSISVVVRDVPNASILTPNPAAVCQETSVTFQVQGTLAGSVLTYTIDGDSRSPITINQANTPTSLPAESTLNKTGQLVLRLVSISHPNGCSQTLNNISESVTINQNPVVQEVTTDQPAYCNGKEQVEFSSSVTNRSSSMLTYDWIVAGVLNEPNQSNFESMANLQMGAFSLKVTDANGCMSERKFGNPEVIVHELPTASITPVDSKICQNTQAQVRLTGTTGATVEYTVNGTMKTATIPNTLSEPTNAGNNITFQLVRVIQTNAGTNKVCDRDLSQQQPVEITVDRNPIINNVMTDALVYCEGDPVNFSSSINTPSGSQIQNYDWDVEGVSNEPSQISFTRTANTQMGSYSLQVTDMNGCGNGMRVSGDEITVNELPDAQIIVVNQEVCQSFTAEVSLEGTNGARVEYRVNNGAIKTANIPATLSEPTPDDTDIIFTLVSVENTTTGCDKPLSQEVRIIVHKRPEITSVTTDGAEYCEVQDQVRFQSSVVLGDENIITFDWSGDGLIDPPNQMNFSQTSNTDMQGVYTLEVIDENNCKDRAETNAIISHPLPEANNITAPQNEICVDNEIELMANPSGQNGPFTIMWNLNTSNSSASIVQSSNPSEPALITGLNNGGSNQITYVVVDDNGCRDVSQAFNLIVNPLPNKPQTTNNRFTDCANELVNELSVTLSNTTEKVNWFDEDDVLKQSGSRIFNPNVTAPMDYSFFAEAESDKGCKSRQREEVNYRIWAVPVPGVDLAKTTFGVGEDVRYSDLSMKVGNGGDLKTFTFSFGHPDIPDEIFDITNVPMPTNSSNLFKIVRYPEAGVFDLNLEVIDENQCREMLDSPIKISISSGDCVLEISPGDTTICENTAIINYTAEGDGNTSTTDIDDFTNYEWFVNGLSVQNGVRKTYTHTYNQSGEFNIEVIATFKPTSTSPTVICADQITSNISISNPGTMPVNKLNFCLGERIFVSSNNPTIDNSDVLFYYLHRNAQLREQEIRNNDLNSIVAISVDSFDTNTLDSSQDYFISSVVGKKNNLGDLTLNGACISISDNPTPIDILPEPSVLEFQQDTMCVGNDVQINLIIDGETATGDGYIVDYELFNLVENDKLIRGANTLSIQATSTDIDSIAAVDSTIILSISRLSYFNSPKCENEFDPPIERGIGFFPRPTIENPIPIKIEVGGVERDTVSLGETVNFSLGTIAGSGSYTFNWTLADDDDLIEPIRNNESIFLSFREATKNKVTVTITDGNNCSSTYERVFIVRQSGCPTTLTLSDSIFCVRDEIVLALDPSGFPTHEKVQVTWTINGEPNIQEYDNGEPVVYRHRFENSGNLIPIIAEYNATNTTNGNVERVCGQSLLRKDTFINVLETPDVQNISDLTLCLGSSNITTINVNPDIDNLGRFEWELDGRTQFINSNEIDIQTDEDSGDFDLKFFAFNGSNGCKDSTEFTVTVDDSGELPPEKEDIFEITRRDTDRSILVYPDSSVCYRWFGKEEGSSTERPLFLDPEEEIYQQFYEFGGDEEERESFEYVYVEVWEGNCDDEDPDCTTKAFFPVEGTFSEIVLEERASDNPTLDSSKDLSVYLFPNPANNHLNLQITGGKEGELFEIAVHDVSGKQIKSDKIEQQQPGVLKYQLNTSQLRNSLYLIEVIGEQGHRSVEKFVIQR